MLHLDIDKFPFTFVFPELITIAGESASAFSSIDYNGEN